jgi:hypothetical protein
MVLIPFAVGLRYYKRVPSALWPIIILCGVWSAAEIYSYVLRMQSISNAHVSFILTVLEVYLFCAFFRALKVNQSNIVYQVTLTVVEYFAGDGQFNKYTLTFEYVVVTYFAVRYLLNASDIISSIESRITLIILSYMLLSFPYFLSWDWLRVTNINLLKVLGNTFAFSHAGCYLLMAYVIWKHSSSYSVRSSYR